MLREYVGLAGFGAGFGVGMLLVVGAIWWKYQQSSVGIVLATKNTDHPMWVLISDDCIVAHKDRSVLEPLLDQRKTRALLSASKRDPPIVVGGTIKLADGREVLADDDEICSTLLRVVAGRHILCHESMDDKENGSDRFLAPEECVAMSAALRVDIKEVVLECI